MGLLLFLVCGPTQPRLLSSPVHFSLVPFSDAPFEPPSDSDSDFDSEVNSDLDYSTPEEEDCGLSSFSVSLFSHFCPSHNIDVLTFMP